MLPSPSKFQILLVDDSAFDAKLFEQALEKAGTRAKLYWVATAEEGLEFVNQTGRFTEVGGVNLIVTDLNLHGMNGFEFLTELRRLPHLAGRPIVVFSGSSSDRDIHQSYLLGANSYIVKPMSIESWVSAVNMMVRYWLDIVKLPSVYLD